MLILAIMLAGGVIGFIGVPKRAHAVNLKVQVACTAVLIFAMGVSLGSREGFFQELVAMGWEALVLSILPMAGSTLLVYILTQRLLPGKERHEHDDRHSR